MKWLVCGQGRAERRLAGLLDQVDGPVALFLADGACDGEPTSDLLAVRFGSMIGVTIPAPKTAILSASAGQDPTARDCQIAAIAARGRMVWQKATGYNQRSRGETLMFNAIGSLQNNQPAILPR